MFTLTYLSNEQRIGVSLVHVEYSAEDLGQLFLQLVFRHHMGHVADGLHDCQSQLVKLSTNCQYSKEVEGYIDVSRMSYY